MLLSPDNGNLIHQAASLSLFEFTDKNGSSRIELIAAQTIFKKRVEGKDIWANTTIRKVKFHLCGHPMNNSYEALAKTVSLIQVFEHRQYGDGQKSMAMSLPYHEGATLTLFGRVVPYKRKFESLELGWRIADEDFEQRVSQVFHIGYVIHFRHALLRAMSWLTPDVQVEFMPLKELL